MPFETAQPVGRDLRGIGRVALRRDQLFPAVQKLFIAQRIDGHLIEMIDDAVGQATVGRDVLTIHHGPSFRSLTIW